jgi:hypothetical protein
VWREEGHLPGDEPAPVVPDDHCLLNFQCVEEPSQITDEMVDRVLIDCTRRISTPVAALIRSDCAKACRGESLQLMAPRIPELGPAVAEENRNARSRLCDVHGNAVGVDLPMGDDVHGIPALPKQMRTVATFVRVRSEAVHVPVHDERCVYE